MGTAFADPVLATAILGRLPHDGHVVGERRRLRARRRSGLPQKPAAQDEPGRERTRA